jgi:hypothetical protein
LRHWAISLELAALPWHYVSDSFCIHHNNFLPPLTLWTHVCKDQT